MKFSQHTLLMIHTLTNDLLSISMDTSVSFLTTHIRNGFLFAYLAWHLGFNFLKHRDRITYYFNLMAVGT